MSIITTGIQNAPLACRLEIGTFVKDKDVFNLYLLAIERMQEMDQDDPSSWFQIAGIHGRPYKHWDNVGDKGNFTGYCCHSSVLFPSWHRPYLALFEQLISKHVFEIAHDYPDAADRKRYLVAAQRFRIPYWDWAIEPQLPAEIATQETIDVHTPKGMCQIKNPLLGYTGYTFHPLYSDFGDWSTDAEGVTDEKTWESWQETVRYPTTTDKTAKSQPASMQLVLKNNTLTLRDRTYNLLTQVHDWFAFSHDGTKDDQAPVNFDSIESIHNEIHGLAGSNGHMGVVAYAAFDPIFWMHHANVDRILAIWQAINPGSWVTPGRTATGTFTAPAHSTQDVTTDLTPFRTHCNPDKFWTSDMVCDTTVFNYTYPEFENWASLSHKEKSIHIHNEVNRLYGKTSALCAMAPWMFAGLENTALGNAAAPPGPATPTGDKYHEWFVNISVKKFVFNSTFFVHVFLGNFSADPEKWALEESLVGSHVIFANNATNTGCGRCRDQEANGTVVTGMIPLTGVLASRLGGVHKLVPDEVIPHLREHLKWRVQRRGGAVVDPTTLPSLEVTVGRADVQMPKSAGKFASWEEVEIYRNVGNA